MILAFISFYSRFFFTPYIFRKPINYNFEELDTFKTFLTALDVLDRIYSPDQWISFIDSMQHKKGFKSFRAVKIPLPYPYSSHMEAFIYKSKLLFALSVFPIKLRLKLGFRPKWRFQKSSIGNYNASKRLDPT
ncbi:hypothetical protein TNIN_471751 [Trichonephila inaurata madagascariensis]|uniref:Uncharacterized protein n=1 Tax=Trichonephila inaurata madagascariensis TaxID=2747483 RepID=A0A8X6XRR4_9ARAC|nr:hypothetical protein TNIN_471751 [Trichonephila inaurata madagascariensis]